MPTSTSITLVYANCAGGARRERSDPHGLGRYVRSRLGGEQVAAVGLSEVVLSRTPATGVVPRSCPFGEPVALRPLGEPLPEIDDLRAFEAGFLGHAPCSAYYLAHLNSDEHRHPDALAGKWRGCGGAARLAEQTALSRTVYQGTGALLPRPATEAVAFKLRPCGPNPLRCQADDPWSYRGSRDTEPRSALVLRGVPLPGGGELDLVVCQLESHSGDPRVGTEEELAASPGQRHREAQVLELGRLLDRLDPDRVRPVALMGDFNARLGAPELRPLAESLGFCQILPAAAGAGDVAEGEDLLLRGPPVPERTDEAQGWPVSHLSHRILIDHAFVRGLDPPDWECALEVLALPDERPGRRFSDHRPLVLRITRC